MKTTDTNSFYPPGWPHCVYCGDYALDGHLTCGRAQCDESRARGDRDEAWRVSQADCCGEETIDLATLDFLSGDEGRP